MYKRKIYSKLREWKDTPHHKPIVIKGVRQCGKTVSVKDFAERNYKNVIYFDFREHPDYKRFFTPNIEVNSIIMRMSVDLPEADFSAEDTCLIFDEIQDCPMARASLKYFYQDGRYDVMCTGSLLGVNGYKEKQDEQGEDESIPVGFEELVTMYPMDFEEWLWAANMKKMHFDYLHDCFNKEVPVDESIHETMRRHFLNYIIVGGMPEVVQTFFDTKQMNKVLAVQRRIVEEYRADMVKYAPQSDKSKILECFDSIPSQLAREYKKFSYSVVKPNGRGRDYAGSLKWIEDAGIIRRCYNIETTELPLEGHKKTSEFKVYLSDIGLLISMLEEGTQGSILHGDLRGYKGAIFENIMADILGKMERKLYYFHKDSGLELDFVLRYKGECVPLECKARTGRAKSMSTVIKNKEVYHINHALKLGDYNIGRKEELLTMPMYMGYLLIEY